MCEGRGDDAPLWEHPDEEAGQQLHEVAKVQHEVMILLAVVQQVAGNQQRHDARGVVRGEPPRALERLSHLLTKISEGENASGIPSGRPLQLR